MGEDEVSADEARQVPWLKRTKAQRKAIVAEANARSEAKQKERLDRINQWHERGMDKINARAQQSQAPAQSGRASQSEIDRRLHRTSRLLEITAWLDLLPYILGAVVFVIVLVLIVLVVVL